MKSKIPIRIPILIYVIALSTSLHAQFKVDAQLRNRFELRDGYRGLSPEGATPAGLIWQRTRISFSYETENFKLKLTPQDVRLWGDESIRSSTGVFGDDASLELFEGYAELKLGNLGWVSIGRQELKYDNQRLLAARNWNNNGLTYDAVLFKLKAADWNIHLGSTWNSLAEASSDNLYPVNRIKNLNFLWANRAFGENLTLSLLHTAVGTTETDTTNMLKYKQTTGFYTTYKKDGLNLWGEAYYQYGKTNTGKDVSAWLLAVDGSYKAGNFTPGLGITILSGNSKTGTEQTTENLFDVHYGARHRFFGYMDYYRNFSSHTKQGGLADYYFYLDYKFSKSVSVRNIGHYFQLAQTNPTTPTDKNLGYENDLVLKYKFSDWGTLESGYIFYLPTETLETIQGVANAGLQQFVYVQLTLTPTLFQQ
ncbi:MAG: alginate export family protein [Mariniphaga sp.]